MQGETDLQGQGKQVIARAAAVLRAVGEAPAGISLGGIAAATRLPRTTVHRIVVALQAQQLVRQTTDGVVLGSALATLAASAHIDVVPAMRPFLETLGRRVRETVDLCVYRGPYSLCVDQYPSDQELRVVSPIGTAFPVHTTAHGKALLAQLDDDTLKALMTGRLERSTTMTVKSMTVLRSMLAEIREKGYAVDNEEHAPGVCGVGTYLHIASNERYALAIAAPAQRFVMRLKTYRAELLKTKMEIEEALGTRRG